MVTVIERARRYVQKCGPAISGHRGHDQTFHIACLLVHGFGLSDGDALIVLREWNATCSPPWIEVDLIHKIKSARSARHKFLRGYLLGSPVSKRGRDHDKSGAGEQTIVRPPKPMFCPMVLKRIAGKAEEISNVVEFLRLASPVCVDSQDSASVLRRLYRRGSGEKVLIFTDLKSQAQFLWEANKSDVTQDRQFPTGTDGVWFLPQPVTGEFHPNPRLDGRLSRRSEESVTAWRYAVLESDGADADDWLRCLVQMPLRIASICESGGRSIHALVQVDAPRKTDWDSHIGAIKPLLVALGADAGALSAVRLSRLPQAKRGERVQRLLFLNPQPDAGPILQLSTQVVPYGRKWTVEDTHGG